MLKNMDLLKYNNYLCFEPNLNDLLHFKGSDQSEYLILFLETIGNLCIKLHFFTKK